MKSEVSIFKILYQAVVSVFGAAVIFPLFLGCVFFVCAAFLSFFPNYHFYNELGFFPNSEISELKTSSYFFEDEFSWIKFKGNENILNKITKDEFIEVDRNSIKFDSYEANEILNDKETKFFRRIKQTKELPQKIVVIAYNKKSEQTFILKRRLYD